MRGDCLSLLPTLPRASIRLAYIDPPFNTGQTQHRTRVRGTASANGTRKGFSGQTYTTKRLASPRYEDTHTDYLGFLMPRIEACLPALASNASLFIHLDAREVHYVKVAMDQLLGRDRFINEIIWAYDYGGRPRTRWPAKHDTILWYALDPRNYIFNYDAIDRIPYMAPGLVTPEKAARGKTPTDVWWHTIVPTNSREKTGYPTQKPLGILRRIVAVHSNPGDTVLDFFAGSGTTGAAALELGRSAILIDNNPAAIRIMQRRLSGSATPPSPARTRTRSRQSTTPAAATSVRAP